MGLLYDVETHTINYHLKRIFADSDLPEDSVIRNFQITAADGKTYKHRALQSRRQLRPQLRSQITPSSDTEFTDETLLGPESAFLNLLSSLNTASLVLCVGAPCPL